MAKKIILIIFLLAVFIPYSLSQKKSEDISKLYERATTARDQKNYQEAVSLLEKIYQIKPDPKLLQNIALVYEESGNRKKSIIYYQKYINAIRSKNSENQESLKKEQDDIKGIICQLTKEIIGTEKSMTAGNSRIEITSLPPGSVVFIDGIPACITPCLLDKIEAGQHEILVGKYGHDPYQETLIVENGKVAKISEPLKPQIGEIAINSWFNDTEIYIGSSRIGKGSISVSLPFESYNVKCVQPEFDPFFATADIIPGEKVEKLCQFGGKIKIETQPKNAEVFVDGENKGRTPIKFFIALGIHKISIEKKGYDAISEVIFISKPDNGIKKFNLQKQRKEKEIKIRVKIGGKIGGMAGTAKVDSASVKEVFSRRSSAIRYCYDEALKVNQNLKGKVKVKFTIGPAGRVTEASAVENETGDSALAACIISKILTWKFDPPEGGSVTFTYPFTFPLPIIEGKIQKPEVQFFISRAINPSAKDKFFYEEPSIMEKISDDELKKRNLELSKILSELMLKQTSDDKLAYEYIWNELLFLKRGIYDYLLLKENKEKYYQETSSKRQEIIIQCEHFLRLTELIYHYFRSEKQIIPYAMYYLGFLYMDESEDKFFKEDSEYEKQLILYQKGKIATQPKALVIDYKKNIELYRKIQDKFPDFRHCDAVTYLEGYLLGEMDEWDASIKAFQAFVEKYPKSEYAPEVLIRLGNSSFDYGEYDKAISYYSEAMKEKKSKFYLLMAFYKYAWSFFQKYDYPAAINSFKNLIEYIDEFLKQNHETSKIKQAQEMRIEAIDNIAGSFAEDDWNNDGLSDPDCGVQRAMSFLSNGYDYEHEIKEKYAEILYSLGEEKKYFEAVEVLKILINENPLDLKNPAYQEKIIYIYDTINRKELSIQERQKYVQMFDSNSLWHKKNDSNAEIINQIEKQIEIYLREIAFHFHKHAQELKLQAETTGDESYNVQSLKAYQDASKAYTDYLNRYPESEYSFEMTNYLAETYYFSNDFEKAGDYYLKMIQMKKPALPKLISLNINNLDDFLEDIASNMIDSYKKEIEKQINDGSLSRKADIGQIYSRYLQDSNKVEEMKKIEPETIPQVVKKFISAIDIYIEKGFKKKNEPSFIADGEYGAGLACYNFQHFEEARKRFRKIMDKYPKEIIAIYSGKNITKSYIYEYDYENLETWLNFYQKWFDNQDDVPDNVKNESNSAKSEIEKTRKDLKKIKIKKMLYQAFLFKESKYFSNAIGQNMAALKDILGIYNMYFLSFALLQMAVNYKNLNQTMKYRQILKGIICSEDEKLRDTIYYHKAIEELTGDEPVNEKNAVAIILPLDAKQAILPMTLGKITLKMYAINRYDDEYSIVLLLNDDRRYRVRIKAVESDGKLILNFKFIDDKIYINETEAQKQKSI